jgi:NAD(P)-dependent dehydrogenase (short-subunit alcohol dehydrogenase family)
LIAETVRSKEQDMTIIDKDILVTGANRGIGRALVEEALRRGAKRVYAGTRRPLGYSDARVTPLLLDVTDAAQIQAAVERVESLDILVNNAGIALYDDLSDRAALDQQLAVNLFGTYAVTQAFLPLLIRSRGAIVNGLSATAFAPLPLIPAYSLSKAAVFSLSLSWRALLRGRGVSVHAVLTGPVDTDMTRGFDIPKTFPRRPSPAGSSTAWRTGRRRSSPFPCRRPWPRVGAAVRPRRWNAKTRRSCRRNPSRHEQHVRSRHTQRERIMNGPDFTTAFTVDQTPAQAFAAINNVRGWWSGEIEGSTDELGAEFTYRYEDVHYTKQKITDLVPGERVVWLVEDAHLNFTEDAAEWKGTEITFEIADRAGQTESASPTSAWSPTMSVSKPVRAPGASISTAVCGA